MNKKEMSEHLELFSKWKASMYNRIDQWKKTLPTDISSKLDMSPESLLLLEKYLSDTYPDSASFRDPVNSSSFDAIATYIGEVYRLNLPGHLEWKSGSDEVPQSQSSNFYFPYEVGLDFKLRGEDPTRHLPFVLHTKPGNKLFEYLTNGLTKSCTESIALAQEVKNEATIPGVGGYSYQHFLLLSNNSYRLNDLENVVHNFYSKRSDPPKVYLVNDVRLVVEFTKDFCFHFWYDNNPGVLTESMEIAKDYTGDHKDKAIIASCKHRIEFWGDTDSKGEYFNEHLFVLSHIVKIPGIFVFDFKQGIFYDENE